jgi:hypothetical protein
MIKLRGFILAETRSPFKVLFFMPYTCLTYEKNTVQLLAARRLAFLLDVHGKLNELVCKLCFLENFLGDVCAGLDNDNTVVGYNVTCCFFSEKETAVTFFGSLVGSSFFCRSCRFCRFLLRSFFLFRLRFFFLLRLFFLGRSCRLFLFLFRSRCRCRCRCRSCRSRCRSCLCRLCYRLSFFFSSSSGGSMTVTCLPKMEI